MRRRFPEIWPTSDEKYLYHYTHAATALTKILPSRTLRASPFVDLNDPRESKAWSFVSPECDSYNPKERLKLELENQRIREEARIATQLAQQSTRVLCFSRDDQARQPRDLTCPLGRGFSNSAMWTHYAANHSGVCLVFDKNRLDLAINAWYKNPTNKLETTGWKFEGNVEYLDRENDFTFLRVVPHAFEPDYSRSLRMETLSHVNKYHRQLFFQKSLDWKYENEYRYIFWGEGTDPMYIPFENALVGIVVGEDFGQHPELGSLAQAGFIRTMDNQCRELGIKNCMLGWHNGIPFLAGRSHKKW